METNISGIPRQYQVIEKLTELGTNADEISLRLEQLNIQGYKSSTKVCPIAVYLNKMFSDVHFTLGTITLRCHSNTRMLFSELLPSQVTTFIAMFDRGLYPKNNAALLV